MGPAAWSIRSCVLTAVGPLRIMKPVTRNRVKEDHQLPNHPRSAVNHELLTERSGHLRSHPIRSAPRSYIQNQIDRGEEKELPQSPA